MIVRENVVLGRNVKIGSNSTVEPNAIIQDNSRVSSDTKIGEYCRIGKNVFIGNNVTFSCDKYPPSDIIEPIIIHDNAIVGAGCILCSTVEIGKNTIVGAGSLVLKPLRSNHVFFGHPVDPSKPYCTREEYEKRKAEHETVRLKRLELANLN